MKYLILIMTFLTSTMAFSQVEVRDVYYMNGFPSETVVNNANTRWIQTMVNHATRASINPIAFGYTNADGLQVGATSAVSNMIGTNTSSQAIAIGASFGGTVIRQIDANGGAPFGGFITVGSPNKGTILAQTVNENPESVTTTIETWSNDVMAGPLFLPETILGASPVFIVGELVLNIGLNFLIDKIPFPGSEQTVKEMVNNPPQSVIDLNPSSAAMTALNDFNTNLPFVQITVEENEPQSLYRMAGSNNAHEAPLGQFDDSGIVQKVDIAAGYYEGMKTTYLIQKDIDNVFGFVLFALGGQNPFNFPEAKADAWARGQEAFESNIETDWQQLVGGTSTTTYSSDFNGCEIDVNLMSYCNSFSDGNMPNECIDFIDTEISPCEPQTQTAEEILNAFGVLPNDSYIPVPYQVFNEDIAVLPVLGCNHNEMVNHPGVIQAFEDIFDGEASNVESFFESDN